MELLGTAAANFAAVSVDDTKFKAESFKDRRVSRMHDLVAVVFQ